MKAKGNFITRSIGAKLITLFLLVSLVPIIILGILSYIKASDALKESEFDQLRSVGDLKTLEVTNYLDQMVAHLNVLTRSEEVMEAFLALKEYHGREGSISEGRLRVSVPEYRQIFDEVSPSFDIYVENYELYDLFLLCEEHGHVLYSYRSQEFLGALLPSPGYRNTNLTTLWEKVKSDGQPVIVDFQFFEPYGGPAAFMGAPVIDSTGDVVAVVALQLNAEKIDAIMQQHSGMGETGETYLVGDDYLMRSNSRFSAEPTILRTEVRNESVRLARENSKGVHMIRDYRGVEVLSYYSYLELRSDISHDFDWVILAEMDVAEALGPAHQLRGDILLIGLVSIMVVLVLSYLLSAYFTRPLKHLTFIARHASKGDFTREIQVGLNDEIGVLADSFASVQKIMREKAYQAAQIADGNLNVKVETLSENDEMGKAFGQMVQNLKEQLGNINNVVSLLTAGNSQLMTTISQLSSASSETATTVSQVSTTIEEVKQTTELAAQKARNVSTTAQKSVQYSESGIRATEDSVEGMLNIQEQMRKIADTIIKLSEQSQLIGEITNSVQDLAEQSNLLAVNASIEAVKAGEYGKGFGVVAQEIRALADQSKQSTRQIREILNDVQKAISSAVMATEEGGKAVDSGVSLAEASGDSISMLADSINEAATSSAQIAASSGQQQTGMEQLAEAIDNIRQAAVQNATGTRQAEEAAGSFKKIIDDLNDLLDYYQID